MTKSEGPTAGNERQLEGKICLWLLTEVAVISCLSANVGQVFCIGGALGGLVEL